MKQRILLIDDDQLVLKSFSKVLEANNYEVHCCDNGADACNEFQQGSIDLIISDVRMPRQDGIQTVQQIRQIERELNLSPVPVIMITGYAESNAPIEALRAGVQDYLTKPFDIKDLLTSVDFHLKNQSSKSAKRVYQYASFFLSELSQLKFEPKVISSQPAAEIIIHGKKAISFASNNVLGLGVDRDVVNNSFSFIQKYGTTCGGSRLVSGNLSIQEDFERKLALFMGKEASQLFMTGYMANEGILLALTQRISLLNSRKINEKIVILCDRENHISIVHGCWLAKQVNGVEVRFYRHKDINHLQTLLEEYKTYARKFIISEGLFSMLGDTAPLTELVYLAKKYDAFFILDDAHAIGVFGDRGRGTSEYYGVTDDVDLIVGTLSKAFGAVGGFVVSSELIVRFLKVQCPTYIFSSALPPSVIGGVNESLTKIQEGNYLRETLWSNVNYVKKNLINVGFNLLNSNSHIIPIFIGDESTATGVSMELLKRGIFIPEIRWPAVSKENSILRCMVTAQHTQEHLERLISALSEISSELKTVR